MNGERPPSSRLPSSRAQVLLRTNSLRCAALALPALIVGIVGLVSSSAASPGEGAYTASDGWIVLLEPLELSRGWRAAAAAIALAALTFPAGLLSPSRASRLGLWFAVGAIAVVAATVLTSTGLEPSEAIVMATGFACGVASGRAAARGRLLPVLAVLTAAAFITLLALVPREGNPSVGSPRLSLLGGRRGGADALANIALFVPLGLALAGAKLRAWQSAATAALLSIAVETAQYWIPGRSPAVGDVVMNTLGGLTGWLLLRPITGIWKKRHTPVALTLLVSTIAPAIIAATGWLLTPVVHAGEYRVQWAPARRNMQPFDGQLTAVRIADQPLPQGTDPGQGSLVRDELFEGAPLVVRGTAGSRAVRPSPLLRIVVRGVAPPRVRETFVLITHRDDALLRVGQRAREFRLFEPYYRFPGTFAAVSPGDALIIEARRAGRGWCLRVGANASCPVSFGIGDGWALLVSSATIPGPVRTTLSWIWIVLLAVPAGVVAPGTLRPALAHASGMGAAIGLSIWLPGTLVLGGWEAGLLAGGYLAALLVARAVRVTRPTRTNRAVDGRPAAAASIGY